MATTLQERVAAVLSRIRNPRTGADVYSTQQVRDIATTLDGRVHLTLLLTREDNPALAKTVREEVGKVDGVIDVQLEVMPVKIADKNAPPAPQAARAPSRALPV